MGRYGELTYGEYPRLVFEDAQCEQAGEGPRLRARDGLTAREHIGHHQ